ELHLSAEQRSARSPSCRRQAARGTRRPDSEYLSPKSPPTPTLLLLPQLGRVELKSFARRLAPFADDAAPPGETLFVRQAVADFEPGDQRIESHGTHRARGAFGAVTGAGRRAVGRLEKAHRLRLDQFEQALAPGLDRGIASEGPERDEEDFRLLLRFQIEDLERPAIAIPLTLLGLHDHVVDMLVETVDQLRPRGEDAVEDGLGRAGGVG